MKKNIKKAWLKALRSGEYNQGFGKLCQTIDGVDFYCCLGVLSNECLDGYWSKDDEDSATWYFHDVYTKGDSAFTLPHIITKDLKITEEKWMDILSEMNDFGQTFEEIAYWIEENL
jgi:predicted aminopeptidase